MRPNIAVFVGPGLRVFTRIPRPKSSAQGFLNREVSPFEIDGYHLVEVLLCHLFEQPEIAVTCIYEDAVQVPELPLDRGEHRAEVRDIAHVRANAETSVPTRLLTPLHRPLL